MRTVCPFLVSPMDGHDMSVAFAEGGSGNEIAHITLSIEKCGFGSYDG